MAKFEGDPLDLGLKLGWGGFQLPSRRYISETVQDKTNFRPTINH